MRPLDNRTRHLRNVSYFTIYILLFLLSSCGPTPVGKIEIIPSESDFGTVANTDPVTKNFEVRNIGTGLLDIISISTSCSCTTATISQNSLKPGEDAILTVTFDPGVHNGATGQFMRHIFIESTDPETPRAVFTFNITVEKV